MLESMPSCVPKTDAVTLVTEMALLLTSLMRFSVSVEQMHHQRGLPIRRYPIRGPCVLLGLVHCIDVMTIVRRQQSRSSIRDDWDSPRSRG
jgi:hypothetical protein